MKLDAGVARLSPITRDRARFVAACHYTLAAHPADGMTLEVDDDGAPGFTGIGLDQIRDAQRTMAWIGRGWTVASQPQTRCYVIPFQLPQELREQRIVAATLQVDLFSSETPLGFSADLYGLRRIDGPQPNILGADHYLGPADPANALLQAGVASSLPNAPPLAAGEITVSNAALVEFLNRQLDAGAAGQFIYLRFNPDRVVDDLPSPPVETGQGRTMRFHAMPAQGLAPHAPRLRFTTEPAAPPREAAPPSSAINAPADKTSLVRSSLEEAAT